MIINDFQDLAQIPAFALLTMGDSKLLVPQVQIVSLEPAMDLIQAPAGRDGDSVGAMRFQGSSVPIFRLNNALEKQQSLDPAHRFCVIFECQGKSFGLLCRQMQSVQRERLILSPIPVCMRQADMLIRALAIFDGAVTMLTHNAALAIYLELIQGGSDG